MPISVDDIDRALIRELQRDADRTNVELARVVGLSPAATLHRVRRLKDSGVIVGIHARVDPAAAGLPLQVHVEVTLGAHDAAAERRFRELVNNTPQIIAGDLVAGETDAILHVVAHDIRELQSVILALSLKGGAQRVVTLLHLEQLKAPSALPLAVEPELEAG
jgi:Lrp/AsnC family transcriptional regulator, leucine-responsive regulatory protein